ncbi:helix-turn-helix domain-containing protein [Heyndrickxia ginsengihumi]|nr:helix-turn-helix domain-containing protein [Heyndrickxia ginsengihumi]
MTATIKDLAKYTNLSLGTISKYINGGTVKPKINN